jgi:maleate isomerase
MSEERKKIGVMLPSSNTTVEYDFQRIVPGHVSIHGARMWVVDSSVEVLERMNEDVEASASASTRA